MPSCHTHCHQDALARLRASYLLTHTRMHVCSVMSHTEDLLTTHLSSLQRSVIFICVHFPVFAFYGQTLTVSEYAEVNAWGVDDKKSEPLNQTLTYFY